MTTLICDFQDIVGERIDGYATLSAGDIRIGQDAPTVVLRTPSTPEQVIEGEATFENVEPGAAVLQLYWSGKTATLRFTVPNTPETVTLSECVEQTLEYTPSVTSRSLEQIEGARDEALGQVDGAVGEAIDTRLLPLEEDVSNAVSSINATGGYAGRLVRLDQDGKLRVLTSSITEPTHVASKQYVDTSRGRAPVAYGDLNDFTTPDVYKLSVAGESTLENHYPEPGVLGTLEVFALGDGGAYPTQRITTWTNTPRIYIRRYAGASWSSWQVFTSDAESAGAVDEAIDTRLLPLEEDVSNAVSSINAAGGYAGRLVRLDQDGKLRVLTSSITDPMHIANKNYVDTSRSRNSAVTGDLDDIKTPDVYRLAVTEEATLENHYPEPGITGILEVYAVGGQTAYPIQRITTWSNTPRIYIRRYTGTRWRSWQTFTSDAERYAQDFTTLDPDGFYAPSGPKLTLPTHDGSGQATHPSVLHFPEGFNGYRYWMAVTPFPNGNDDHEDPNIFVSQDGTTWVVPDGLTNPLDDAPGNPDYNSDTCLSMGPNDTMWCFWRLRQASEGAEVIYGRSTTDGVTWTPREEIIRNDDPDGKLNRLLSPSLVYDSRGAGSWRLWVVNTSDKSPDADDWVKLKHTTGPTGWNFTAWQDVTVAPLQNRYRPWHLSVRYLEGKYVGILCASDSLFQATYDNLMVVGDSPTNFRVSSMPSIERTAPQHTSLYQGSMVPVVTPSGLEWDVFYSGIYAPTNEWNIFRTRMGRRKLGSLRDSIVEKLTPPDSGWRDISDTLREGWTGRVRIRRIGWEVFVEFDDVTRESGTDHRMIRIPRFGFLPAFSTRRSLRTTTGKSIGLSIYTWTGDMGSVQVEGHTSGDVLRGGFSFLTSDRPPSEWPGVPA